MSRTATAITHVLPECTDIPSVLGITPRMWERVQENDKHVRPWLVRYLIDRYKINPLYIYGASERVILS